MVVTPEPITITKSIICDWIHEKGLPHGSNLPTSKVLNFRKVKDINLKILDLIVYYSIKHDEILRPISNVDIKLWLGWVN